MKAKARKQPATPTTPARVTKPCSNCHTFQFLEDMKRLSYLGAKLLCKKCYDAKYAKLSS